MGVVRRGEAFDPTAERWRALASTLDLPSGPPALIDQAREAFVEGDVGGLLVSFSNEHGLYVVRDNADALQERGVYERALVEAYTATRVNWAHWTLEDLRELLDEAALFKLREAGDPIPPGDRFTLYRGVSGEGPARKERGLSWTRSRAKAEWFAERGARWGMADAGVYRTRVRRSRIAFYSNDRNEDDFVLIADRVERLAWKPAA